jgi:hypothetical protein
LRELTSRERMPSSLGTAVTEAEGPGVQYEPCISTVGDAADARQNGRVMIHRAGHLHTGALVDRRCNNYRARLLPALILENSPTDKDGNHGEMQCLTEIAVRHHARQQFLWDNIRATSSLQPSEGWAMFRIQCSSPARRSISQQPFHRFIFIRL